MSERPLPFTYAYYRYLLERIQAAGYVLSSFERFDAAHPKTVILRHDVDYTLDGVLELATIEAELGCNATYLFRVHGEYNPFSPRCVRVMDRLREFEHDLGLHFECMNVGRATRREPLELLQQEKTVLETILGDPVRTCSEHREMSGTIHGTPLFGDVEAVYGMGFEFYAMDPRWCKEMKYLSDSNAVWREGDPLEHLHHDRLQVLVHADWWFADDLLLKGPYHHGTQE